MKLLQTNPQVKNMIINYFDLYYTVIKNRDEKEYVDDKHENDYIRYTKSICWTRTLIFCMCLCFREIYILE